MLADLGNRQRITTMHAHILRQAAAHGVHSDRKNRDGGSKNRPCWQCGECRQGNAGNQHRQDDGQNLEPDALEETHA